MKRQRIYKIMGILSACIFTACAGNTEETAVQETQQPQMVIGEDQDASKPMDTPEFADDPEPIAYPEPAASPETAAPDTEEKVTEFAEVKKTEEGWFTVARIETEEYDNGASTAVFSLNEDEWDLYDVYYTEKTEFIVRSIADRGMSYTDAAGSAADLEIDGSVNLIGTWKDDDFYADQIVIEHFL